MEPLLGSVRVLHVDDDSLMRDIVGLSLGLDPNFTLMTCVNGDEALHMAADWAPDLILCDVMMPDMDGPALLARLRSNVATAKIPVIFMSARAGPLDIAQLAAAGAIGVIAKPFDPNTLAASVRGHMQTIRLASAGYDFAERLRADAAMLESVRQKFREYSDLSLVPEGFESCVHKLAGAAGVFDLPAVSQSASALEEAIIARRAGHGTPGRIEASLDELLDCIARE